MLTWPTILRMTQDKQPSHLNRSHSCRICGALTRSKAFTVREYTYYRCAGCGTVFVAPLPTQSELEQFYNSMYRVDPESVLSQSTTKWQGALALLSAYKAPPGRMLDIGSSWGGFLIAARQAGWSAYGVELSSEAASFCRENLGLDVFSGTLQDSPFVGQPFDVVTFWHVIEHDRDPCAFLQLASTCVRPGGLLAFTTPNVQSLIAWLNGPGWEWATPPAHLHLLSPRSAHVILKHAALEPLVITTRRGDGRPFLAELAIGLIKRIGLGGAAKSALTLPDYTAEDTSRRSPKYNPRLRLLQQAMKVLGWVERPFRPLGRMAEHRLNWGPELLVVARRPV